MALGTDVGLHPGDSVLDGDPVYPPTKGVEPPTQFSSHFYCGQTAGCIKRPLDMEIGLRTGDFVLDGDPPPSQKGGGAPIFGPCLLWPNGWCGWSKVALGVEVGFAPVHMCFMGTQLPSSKRGRAPPNFRLIFIVAKRLEASRCHLVLR